MNVTASPTEPALQEQWLTERLINGIEFRYRATDILCQEETEHQSLVIFENPAYGRIMILDGVIQLTSRDEFVYHEMFVHPALFAHGGVRRVLIVGGGDGGIAREVLKHGDIEQVTLVELDADIIGICRTHLPMVSQGAFDDPRLHIVIGDGAAFVEETEQRFDLIIIDSTDPVGPGAVLFADSFYRNARACLAPGGVMVTQNDIPFFWPFILAGTLGSFRDIFSAPSCYTATIPSYGGGEMAYCWGSDAADLLDPAPELLEKRFAASGIETRYYTPRQHLGAFALPAFIEKIAAL